MKSLREIAVNFLAQREHSVVELQRKLRAKGFSNAEINDTLSQLITDRLQSDERFAEAFAQSRRRLGHGPRRIALELEQRGIAAELVDKMVWSQSDQWRDNLQAIVAKRYGTTPPADQKEKAKRIRFLMQRGFDLDEIREIIE